MFSERAVEGRRVWFGVPGTWGSAPCRLLGTFGRAKSTAPQASAAALFRSAPAFGGSGAEMRWRGEAATEGLSYAQFSTYGMLAERLLLTVGPGDASPYPA